MLCGSSEHLLCRDWRLAFDSYLFCSIMFLFLAIHFVNGQCSVIENVIRYEFKGDLKTFFMDKILFYTSQALEIML